MTIKNNLTICVAILTALTFQKAQAQSLIDVGGYSGAKWASIIEQGTLAKLNYFDVF